MARQPRLVIPGLPHLLWLPALPGLDAFPAATDRARFLSVLRKAASIERLQMHAYALLATEVRLLATPDQAQGLSRCVQAVGRQYVSDYNRIHGRSGTLWSGRFRCAVVEPGAWMLLALRFVDGALSEASMTSAQHRCGGLRDGWLTDPQEYWRLGNTPFERESAYAERLADKLAHTEVETIQRCLRGGWPIGAEGFVREIEGQSSRRASPRPRGRPARRPMTPADQGN